MENQFIYNDLSQEELVSLEGGVRDPYDAQGGSGDYGINSPNGCIPNPFDKILKPNSTF
ncbi:hypothetical protein [Pedobacter sp. GR22-6]|uniref:hypothetical protein n=1 Tax=Pedobacter sp. GR22-6 TaxID=3127957 RepID=UPI00307FBB52